METDVTSLVSLLPWWAQLIPIVITAAGAVATVTPTKADNKVIDPLLRIINIIGLNVGKARNADDK